MAGWRIYVQVERWRVHCPRCKGVYVERLDWRTEADLDGFFATLGAKKSADIELAAMDMWKPFRRSLGKNAPNARVVFDKFHIMRHLGDALDEVRRREYQRLAGQDRAFIRGSATRGSPAARTSRTTAGRACVSCSKPTSGSTPPTLLKESFGQLWSYQAPGWALAFFERWKQRLKWQRLPPYEKFAAMIERHGDGIVSYCHPENKVSLGLVEGLNNKSRVLQRRAYGYRDEEYLKLKLKIVAAFLHPLPRRAEKDPL